MNWLKDGRTDRFRYVRVTWPDMRETGLVEGVVSCTITENSLSSLKASGSLRFAGPFDVGEDLLRVYSDSELGGETQAVCHGTFLVTTPSCDWSGAAFSGTADMYSVLWVLQQNRTVETYTAAAGSNAVELAAGLARGNGNGLGVVATASGKRLGTDHTWDAGTSYLEIVNWLLDFAGYGSADVDAFGNVIMAPYVEPHAKAPAAVFSDTRDSVSEPGFSREMDAFEVPNKVVCICSNAGGEPMVAQAVNDDPESPYSTATRGKLVVRVEQVSDAPDLAALEAKAREILLSGMSVVESVEIRHAFQPFSVGDAVLVDYARAGYSQKLVTVSREKQMIPGMRCRTRARRFVNLFMEG